MRGTRWTARCAHEPGSLVAADGAAVVHCRHQPHPSTHISSVRIAAHLKHVQCCYVQQHDDTDATSVRRAPGTPSVPFLFNGSAQAVPACT